MDSQNNPNPGAPRPEDDSNATPEVSVDLAAQQPSAFDPAHDATTAQSVNNNADDQQPPVDGAVTPTDGSQADAPAIAFTTNSDGTVQTIPASESDAADQGSMQENQQPTDPLADAATDAGSVAVSSETAPADVSGQPAADTQFGAPSAPTEQPVVTPPPTAPTEPVAGPSADAGQGLPPVAPVPVPAKDKKLIVILGTVAVVLLAAIATLVLL